MSEETLVPKPFDYDSLDEQTRVLVQQRTDVMHGLFKRTAEGIIAIGEHLFEVKQLLPDMAFSPWLRAEFDLSRQSAYNFMKVATRFGGSCKTVLQLPAKVLYELASASDTIVAQVEGGHLPPTREAIKAAKEAERQARETEQQVRAELQTQQDRVEQLTRDLDITRLELSILSTPEVQVKEVERVVVPLEMTEQMQTLQQRVTELTGQRERLSQEVSALQGQLTTAAAEPPEGDHDRQIRLTWYKITGEFQRSLRSIFSQWPSSLDVQAFDADDWTRLSQVKELARRFLAECTQLTDGPYARTVEGSRLSDLHEQEDVSQ